MTVKPIYLGLLFAMVVVQHKTVQNFSNDPMQPAPQVALDDLTVSSGSSISVTEATAFQVFGGYDIENQMELEAERRKYVLVAAPFSRGA
ncbi:MAG: hypothetical protein KJ904_18715 [Alphaproteobacteria bacterium]|nr:hypothetical protein [Alphaproteobacteria bacterium]MBU0796289.1 hypothetical protein [Alphaproteobacteria bacterium]MBU0889194.1 hypothetical protein [Alphaproteobacteria bacterium]MBU1812228.1 hypothetical protein [Alphaproteobacteria bacterium]